ncbi:MAG TPA: MBL fold metallo-hydrolase [Rubrivivax sp.]|nr:MBL fold metallo-hydrolase [Rubrivivax sp.]
MSATLPDWATDCGGGVFAVDTGFHRPRFDAAYVLVGDGGAAVVDTGPNAGVPRILALLDALGIARDAVRAVIPTHVHLDHAGGAGALMQALPRATMWVHPRGAPHMIDPSKLYAGSLAVYGQTEMDRSYGTLVPVQAERVRTTEDGMTLALAGRRLRFADTPGHALHHHCVWDEATRGWFTGDTFGLSYREFDTARGAWILPSCTPVQFDPEAYVASVRRLLAAGPLCMYPTHFGRIGNGAADVARLGELLIGLIESFAALGRAHAAAPDRHARLREGMLAICRASLAAHGCMLSRDEIDALLALDAELDAQGIAVWLDRQARRGAGAGAGA